jgi:hypothetical protein
MRLRSRGGDWYSTMSCVSLKRQKRKLCRYRCSWPVRSCRVNHGTLLPSSRKVSKKSTVLSCHTGKRTSSVCSASSKIGSKAMADCLDQGQFECSNNVVFDYSLVACRQCCRSSTAGVLCHILRVTVAMELVIDLEVLLTACRCVSSRYVGRRPVPIRAV